jgi:C-terminal processing protease CtpA/Prc
MFKIVEKFPQSNEFFTSDIGSGLTVTMPLALYKDSIGTLPRTDSLKLKDFLNKVDNEVPQEFTAKNRAVRLAGVVISWNVFNHFYPYFDVIKADWNAELTLALKEAAGDKTECDFLNTLRKFFAKLEDGHITVMHKCDAHYSYYPPFSWEWIEDNLVITKVFEKAKDELKPGDIIIEVNGAPVRDVLLYEEQYISGATLQWKRNKNKRFWFQNSLMMLLSDFEHSNIELTVRRGDKQIFMREIRRTLTQVYAEPDWQKIEEKSPGIFYVDLTRINDDDFNKALAKLVKAKGIVFDLRGYPASISSDFIRHIIKTNVNSAIWMVPVYLNPDKKDVVYSTGGRWDLSPLFPYLNAKIAFITDGRAISYAESIMGIVEYYKLGEIVGEPTAGTNGNTNLLTLPGGYRASWTGMKVLKHDGSQHHGIGIQPTIPIRGTIKGVVEGRDEQLEKALEVVGK